VEHTEDVVVGDDEQVRGGAEGRVLVGQQPGIDMAVRADDGEVRDPVVQLACHAPLGRVGCEETIG